MKRILLTAACALLGAALAQAAKVASVAVKNADGSKDEMTDVLVRCQTKAGIEYDAAQCDRDVRALRDTGEYEDIRVEVEKAGEDVDVTFVVLRKRRFAGPLNAKGNDYWNEGKIAKHAGLVDGYAYGEADLIAAADSVRREYVKKFFTDCRVRAVAEPVPGNPGAMTVTMEIEEGERKKVRDFLFEGNGSVEADDLRAAFDQYPWWNPIGWFTDVPATEQDYAEACDKIRALYRDRGFLDAEVSMPREERVDGGKYDRIFTVREGPRYLVGTMSVSGLTKYPEDAALAAVRNLKKGDVAGEAALRDAARAIEIFCGSGTNALSETHVAVRRKPRAVDPTVLDLEFAVKEGVPVTIDRVLVRGNDYTKDKVIRREISLSPGDRMLDDKAEQSKRRLENLRYFERVRYYLEKTDRETVDGDRELRDLVYEVDEKNTGNFMVGVGASSVDSVYGTVELTESNFDLFNPWRFRGAGQKGRISVSAGPRVQIYEASVTEPHLFDRLLELTVEVYRRQRWYDDYDVIRNGASVTLAYPVKFWPTWRTFGRLGVRLSAEYIEFDDVESDQYYLPDDLGSHRKGDYGPVFKWQEDEYGDSWEFPLRVFWEDDTRDQFLFPKKGHHVNVYGEVTGGDNEYWRAGFGYRQYFTVWKKYSHVFSWNLRGQTIDAFSDSDGLPIYDRLFLGGPRSIRGVDYREIAPRVYRKEGKKGSYAAWGGQTSWCLTGEYTVPVFKMLRLAAFSDLGSVGADEFDFDSDWLCWSVGLGLRVDLESFPIRLDFAVPVSDPDEDVDEEVFSFTVGYDF